MLERAFPPLKYFNFPNIISSIGLFCGFVSFIFIAQGNLKAALFIYPWTLMLDSLDGTVARKMHCSSQFGLLLDSFCDGFNFCIVPVFIAYTLGFNSWLAVGLLFLHLVTGIWRLVYYCIIGTQAADSAPYFLGVTTTLSAALFYVGLSVMKFLGISNLDLFFIPFFLIISVSMISSYKLKKYGFTTVLFSVLIPLLWILNFFI
jgi:CDP-diacylglycerol--serine O-phosphatidyltransferase